MERVILLVDMQTFYASCEKVGHPDWQSRPLIVAGDPKRRSGIVLAACPVAKKCGVITAETIGQALMKCPEAIVVRPRMQHYIDVSLMITHLLETFTDLVEPYSIDEQFLDVTGSLHFFSSPFDLAKRIQQSIMKETGIHARIGIGSNKSLAKMACDNFSKKNTSGIYELRADMLATQLWPLPIGCLLGVGRRMERHLFGIGIRKIAHLAHYPIDQLRRRWGINGELLWLTAHGIDSSPVSPTTFAVQKAVGHHMTLPVDYVQLKDIQIILLELSEEVAYRARQRHYRGSVISIGVTGSFDRHTHVSRQMTLPFATNFGMDIYRSANRLFTTHWDQLPVRGLALTLTHLQAATFCQLDLFGKIEASDRLSHAVDTLYQKYGRTIICHGVSLLPASQFGIRAGKIGGHFK